MRVLLTVTLIMAVSAAATAADDKSSDSGSSPVAVTPSNPVQSDHQPPQQFGHIIPQIPATSGTPTLSSSGHMLPSPKLHQRVADNRYRAALPRAVVSRAAVPLAAVPRAVVPAPISRSSGLRVIHPPTIRSRAATDDKVRDLVEPLSFNDLPTKPREGLW